MPLTDTTVLVTGATGFLGGEIARHFAQEGAQVKALARRPERDAYIRDIPNIETINGDITDKARMAEVMQGVDLVVHAAAATSGPLEQQASVNIHGTYNVARAAADANVRRLVHISTISVYGYRVRDDVTEETPFDPGADPYHVTKVGAEQTIHDVHFQHGLEYVVLRPGMIYGPRSSMWTKQMFRLSRRAVIWLGDGRGSAYPIHVQDVAEMACLAATHPNAANQTFNVTPDPSPTWRAFLTGYASLAGHERWIAVPPLTARLVAPVIARFAPRNSFARDLNDLVPFLLRHVTYKTDKARDLLDWSPKVGLDEGIEGCKTYLREKGLL